MSALLVLATYCGYADKPACTLATTGNDAIVSITLVVVGLTLIVLGVFSVTRGSR